MGTAEFFSASYVEARAKFRRTAAEVGAVLHTYEHPSERDAGGHALSVDAAFIGPGDATRALLLIAGTHGVEGFAGSGCQVGFFRDGLYGALPRDACVLLVHALNPFGFAWLRRVNEDNVDLNRNFRDFSRPIPPNVEYGALHQALIPASWIGPERTAADLTLQRYIHQHGLPAFQTAVSAGQYTHPTGLFYGGTRPTWSAITLETLLHRHLPPSIRRLVALDIHTGLGPFGYGEPIFVGQADQYARAQAAFGPEVKHLNAGSSISAILAGTVANPVNALSSDCDTIYLGLEFGTRPMDEVLTALRGDHWLHSSAPPDSPLAPELSRAMRDAFYVESPHWQAAVYGRTADFVIRAGRALMTDSH